MSSQRNEPSLEVILSKASVVQAQFVAGERVDSNVITEIYRAFATWVEGDEEQKAKAYHLLQYSIPFYSIARECNRTTILNFFQEGDAIKQDVLEALANVNWEWGSEQQLAHFNLLYQAMFQALTVQDSPYKNILNQIAVLSLPFLHEACKKGHVAIINFFLKQWPRSVYQLDDRGCNPLYYALLSKQQSVVNAFIAHGDIPLVEAPDISESALVFAIKHECSIETIRKLIGASSSTSYWYEGLKVLITLSSSYDRAQLVDILFLFPTIGFHVACKRGDVAVVDFYLQHVVDAEDLRDAHNRNPLYFAMQKEQNVVIGAFIRSHAHLVLEMGEGKLPQHALHYAIINGLSNRTIIQIIGASKIYDETIVIDAMPLAIGQVDMYPTENQLAVIQALLDTRLVQFSAAHLQLIQRWYHETLHHYFNAPTLPLLRAIKTLIQIGADPFCAELEHAACLSWQRILEDKQLFEAIRGMISLNKKDSTGCDAIDALLQSESFFESLDAFETQLLYFSKQKVALIPLLSWRELLNLPLLYEAQLKFIDVNQLDHNGECLFEILLASYKEEQAFGVLRQLDQILDVVLLKDAMGNLRYIWENLTSVPRLLNLLIGRRVIDVNMVDPDGKTLLYVLSMEYIAAVSEEEAQLLKDTIDCMCSRGADPLVPIPALCGQNEESQNVIMFVEMKGHPQLAQCLREAVVSPTSFKQRYCDGQIHKGYNRCS